MAAAWQAVKSETQTTQMQHKKFAEAVKAEVSEFILDYTQGEKQKRENLIKSGDQLLKQIHSQESAVTKAHTKYNKETQSATKAETDFNNAANKSFNQRAKLSTKMDKMKKSATTALAEWQNQQDQLASLKYTTYTDSLPGILEDLQTIEEGREYTMQQAFTRFVELTAQVNDLSGQISMMQESISQIDTAQDMAMFCSTNHVEPDADMPASFSSSSTTNSSMASSMSTYKSSTDGLDTTSIDSTSSMGIGMGGPQSHVSQRNTMGSNASDRGSTAPQSSGTDGLTRARVM
eukprot:TRINITY_DN4930_c0_g1_i2.p1 TRINITY_DN4930_c0_g1~~TRINITY_DN4930_c0_g1_i2.p1  ORF type:complete len:291 (-),score=62.90 TRINITY_DN4930_c0_g1_i2:26-898(-)